MEVIYIGAGIIVAVFLYRMINSKPMTKRCNEMNVLQLRDSLKDEDVVLIDVRTKREIANGVINNPIQIELGPSAKGQLENLDRDSKYVVYCRSGRRSAIFCKIMNKMDFTNVSNLIGGYVTWKETEQAIEV